MSLVARCRETRKTLAIVGIVAVTILLAVTIASPAALQLEQRPRQVQDTFRIGLERWPSSPASEQSWIGYRIGMLEGLSFREQHLNQDALARLLSEDASQLPEIRPCGFKVQYSDPFGRFAIGVSHPDLARRIACLRGVVAYLLRQPMNEFDFRAAHIENAYGNRMGFSSLAYAQQLALLEIYQKGSPLFQLHSVGARDFAALEFDDFARWLRRSREKRLISFNGNRALLEAVGLPVPDPMVIRPVASLDSPRVPGGVLSFEGDAIGVPGLIMVKLAENDPSSVDRQAAQRLGCIGNDEEPRHGLNPGGSAISHVSCEVYDWYGEVWLSLAVLKSDTASDQDFCRQVPELIGDPIVAAFVRSTPEGKNGLYVLLPRRCEVQR
ncbi:hypothetical protein JQ604_30765 [Bradyrhizobium jicamae]|uniref:hypothetical protein n=1 Tax=Bradyrhizobium jicamae TaxID=280332 RepID=UPI001BAABD26|nr:hypothetical protein [Bradyrhizobium jicamae]MBR0756583.1 hypothetical protein [Bradyrhizobium jicamae]